MIFRGGQTNSWVWYAVVSWVLLLWATNVCSV